MLATDPSDREPALRYLRFHVGFIIVGRDARNHIRRWAGADHHSHVVEGCLALRALNREAQLPVIAADMSTETRLDDGSPCDLLSAFGLATVDFFAVRRRLDF
jgi:hypothetical protein